MRSSNSRISALVFGLLPLAVCVTARADDTEIFNISTLNSGAPNVMFILDTSGSMGSTVIKSDPYDPTHTYSGSCTSSSIYYSTTAIPTCSSKTVAPSDLKCAAANTALFTNGASSGLYSGNAIRWLATETKTSSTSTTKTTSQNYNVTYSTTQPGVQPWKKNGGTWKTNGSVVLGMPVTTGPETSTATGSVTNGNTTATAPVTTDTFSYAWTTVFAVPTNTSTNAPTGSTTAASSSVISSTSPTVVSTSNANIDPVPTGGSNGATFNQRVTVTTNYKRTDKILAITGNTTTTTVTNKLYTVSDIECDGDKAAPGTPSKGYPNVVSVNAASDEFTTTKANSYWDNNGGLLKYNMYSGNYINYKANPPGTNQGTRLQVVQQAAKNLLDGLTGVNVGLMRYSDNAGFGDQSASGGMVVSPIIPIDTGSNRSDIKNLISAFTANGNTPLSETLFEAYQYFSGGSVYFGANSKAIQGGFRLPMPSVASSRVGGLASSTRYQSPITASCQSNYIVYLTDGLPTSDTEANLLIPALPNESSLGGTCTTPSDDGTCLGALSQYLYNADLSSQAGTQKVATYYVGFGSDFVTNGQLNTAFSYLQAAAVRGGGLAYQAGDLTELDTTLSKIFLDIGTRDVSFVAPTVAVDAFNRSQTLNDLFFSVFQPSTKAHWPGNVKKYRFANSEIEDSTGAPAVSPVTGFFNHAAQSYWSAAPDGESVVAGGAANKIPDSVARTVYTFIGANPGAGGQDLTTSANYLVDSSNALLTSARLNLGGAGDPTVSQLLSWVRGVDINDDNKNSSTVDARHVMGDPIHSRPSAVIYGGTEANPDIVLFAATNDGYLHAIGGKDTDGVELWAFIPQEFIGGLRDLYVDGVTNPRRYTLDGDVIVMKYDVNNDGIVDPAAGDRVILYFGEARGGNRYHALDVTDRNKPKYLWTIGPSELPGVGQTWSTPTFMRIKVAGATQNTQQLALFIGGGYDPAEDSPGYQTTDSVGNHVYIVDALYGTLLWSDANLALAQAGHAMDHAIPSALSVVDIDSDSYADRFYVGDTAGQVWRFDITNGNSASSLVAGGVIASLGTHDESPHLAINQRRFYYAPSVAFVQPPRAPAFYNIGIGSGYRGHPLDGVTQDRFFSVRDYKPTAAMTQADYNAFTVVTDSSLTDVTGGAAKPGKTSPGWKMLLNQYGGWDGEKILSTARTLDNTIYFQSYTPNTSSAASANSCAQTSIGTNLSYRVNLLNGDIADSSQSVPYTVLKQSGIAPEVVFLFGNSKDTSAVLINTEVQKCASCSNGKSKTYWRSSDSE